MIQAKQAPAIKLSHSTFTDFYLEWKEYTNGRPALVIQSLTDGPLLKASVNFPEHDIPSNHMFIKDYSENEGILTWLIENKIVEDTGERVSSDFAYFPLCKIISADYDADKNRTLKETLQEMVSMWSTLAENGDIAKPLTKFVYDCPCCDYVVKLQFPNIKIDSCTKVFMLAPSSKVENSELFCNCIDDCPLKSLWPKGCNSDDSPYDIWQEADYSCSSDDRQERINQARIIANKSASLLKQIKDQANQANQASQAS